MRIRRGSAGVKRHKKILKLAKGFIGARSRIFKMVDVSETHVKLVSKELPYKKYSR